MGENRSQSKVSIRLNTLLIYTPWHVATRVNDETGSKEMRIQKSKCLMKTELRNSIAKGPQINNFIFLFSNKVPKLQNARHSTNQTKEHRVFITCEYS